MSDRRDISFAHREVMAPVGLWERGAEASGYTPPSVRLLPENTYDALPGAARAPTLLKTLPVNPASDCTGRTSYTLRIT